MFSSDLEQTKFLYSLTKLRGYILFVQCSSNKDPMLSSYVTTDPILILPNCQAKITIRNQLIY